MKDGGISRIFSGGNDFWDRAKPSVIERNNGAPVDIKEVMWGSSALSYSAVISCADHLVDGTLAC